MKRTYDSNEKALAIAKRAVYLAWVAAGGPQGYGIFQDRGEQPENKVWDQAYNQKDYPGTHSPSKDVHCDYVFGRMIKLYFEVKNKVIVYRDSECDPEYQSWCSKYPTYAALFDTAEKELA